MLIPETRLYAVLEIVKSSHCLHCIPYEHSISFIEFTRASSEMTYLKERARTESCMNDSRYSSMKIFTLLFQSHSRFKLDRAQLNMIGSKDLQPSNTRFFPVSSFTINFVLSLNGHHRLPTSPRRSPSSRETTLDSVLRPSANYCHSNCHTSSLLCVLLRKEKQLRNNSNRSTRKRTLIYDW